MNIKSSVAVACFLPGRAKENISFDASLVIYISSTDIPPIVVINRICEHKIF
jgi:hypothetical protein